MRDTISHAHVEINGVSKTYNNGSTTVLNEINLTIGKGEFFCIIGHSGCGKSTLLNLLGGFIKPAKGEIKVQGKAISGPATERGMVFQEYGLFPWSTVLENISFGPLANNKTKKQAKEIAMEYLEFVGLSHVANLYPDQLSGGMKQRVAIARAMANKPEVLLMDEPFGALDAFTRINVREMLQKVWMNTNITIIFVTHSVEEAIFLGQRIGVMKRESKGINKIISVDLPYPRDVYSQPFINLRNQLEDELMEEISS